MLKKRLKKIYFIVIYFLIVQPFITAALSAEETGHLYRIAAGDTLDIRVADHAELSQTTVVIKDGSISLPLVGAVMVQGLTVNEVRVKLEDMYNKSYIANPSVSVSLKEARPQQFFVQGEVKAPGVYSLHEGITVLKAVITAGGFTDYASKSGVRILRKVDGQDQVIRVDVGRIEKGDMAQDFTLMPDDVIVVPQAFF